MACPSCEDHITCVTLYNLECADVSLRIYSLSVSLSQT